MGDTGSSSILVHILVVALCLTAFGFAVAAERRRSTVLTFPQVAFFSLPTASINKHLPRPHPPTHTTPHTLRPKDSQRSAVEFKSLF
jgi:hypothetical protein